MLLFINSTVVKGQDSTAYQWEVSGKKIQDKVYELTFTTTGNPKWQLPPPAMKMVFQGKSAQELALQIKDYNQNGHKNQQQLLEHARDTLVKSGWNMGEGRVAPPLSYTAFLQVWDTWIEKGAYAPAR